MQYPPHSSQRRGVVYGEVGTEKCPGTMMFSLSGAVNRPGVYEMPMGITMRELIEQMRRRRTGRTRHQGGISRRAGLLHGHGRSTGSCRWISIRSKKRERD